MFQNLDKSGVSSTPPVPSTPHNPPSPVVTPMPAPIPLANTGEMIQTEKLDRKAQLKAQAEENFPILKKRAMKLISIALIIQGLFGIYTSVRFILIEYPELETKLVEHLVTQEQVNDFGIKAIMILISTILSMVFAMKLTVMQSKVAQRLNIAIGIFLFISNAMIHDYFAFLNSSQIMVDGILALVNFFRSLPGKFIETNPFLEKAAEGGIKAVWYK